MKTLNVKIVTIFLLLLASAAGFASETGSVSALLNLNSKEQVEIQFAGITDLALEVKVFDNHGIIVFDKILEKGNTAPVNHDISGFPDGFYTYQVIDGVETIYTARVLKSENGLTSCRNLPDCAMASISENENNLVLVRLFKAPGAKMKIKVTDESGNILYTKRIKTGENLRFTHDVSSFPEGNYTFSIYSGNELIAFRKISR